MGCLLTLKNPGEANESARTEVRAQECAFTVGLFILQDPSNLGRLLVPVPLAFPLPCVVTLVLVRRWWCELNQRGDANVKSINAWPCERVDPALHEAV